MAGKVKDEIQYDHNHDGIDRRGLLFLIANDAHHQDGGDHDDSDGECDTLAEEVTQRR